MTAPTDVMSCEHVTQTVTGSMNAHTGNVTCTVDVEHQASFLARCLPDGGHACPEHDPEWPHYMRITWSKTITHRQRGYGRRLTGGAK